jgi:hypothetical protein
LAQTEKLCTIRPLARRPDPIHDPLHAVFRRNGIFTCEEA